MPHNSSMYPIPPDASGKGVTHLQWLAGLAMQSLIVRMDGIPDTSSEREELALWSYRMAQAMKKMELRLQLNETETT